jgi:WD40 repeat protein
MHHHHLSWSADGRFLYFVRGLPTTDETDIWRTPVLASPPVLPERITTHNSRVAYLAWLDDRTLLYSATAENGSGQWLYALDTTRRIPHRVSSGITEQYLSVSVSNTRPRRLIASVATPVADLWTVPISDRMQTEADVRAFPVPNTGAISPRIAADYLLFLSSKAEPDSVYKLKDGAVTELWKGRDGGVVVAPAASRDGTRICFSAREQGRSHLYVMNSDGTNVRLLTDSFDVRSAASWSPDGKWVAVAGNDGKGTYVFKVPVDGGSPVRLTDEASYNPIWSPDGRFIVYSEPLQGGAFLAKAITPDRAAYSIPDIRVFYAISTPYQFTPDGSALVFVKPGPSINFHIVDLKTGREHQLTDLETGSSIRSFDVISDGTIIFDRLRENSDLALIEFPR